MQKSARCENRVDVDIDYHAVTVINADADTDTDTDADDKDFDASDQTNKKIGIGKQTTLSGFEIF